MGKSRWRGPQKSGVRPWSKPDTTCALFRDGQFLTQSIQSDKNQEVVEDIGSCQKRSI